MYNTETIIKKFISIHGNHYDYSKVNFIKTTEKVCIVCPFHGEFYQTPNAHLKGQGCPVCGKEKKRISKTYTNKDFINKSKKIYGDLYDYSEVNYVNSKEKVCIICKEHGNFYIEPNAFLMGRGCPKCGNSNKGKRKSAFMKDVIEYIYSIEDKKNVITNYSFNDENIDIFISNRNVGINFISLKKHNEKYVSDKRYFQKKSDLLEKHKIQLIHIFEDEWRDKKNICKSRINNILGKSKRVFARNCEIINVDKITSKNFFNENHIQGDINSCVVYGLKYNNEIVSMMSFGGFRKNMGRNNSDNEYELLRFCNKLHYSVVGGASKLFKYFIKEKNPMRIISYADRRWSIGNLYKQLDFTFSHISEPSYFYIINNNRKNRFAYRKDVLISKYGCDINDTEHNFCKKNGWYRIYDCGTKVYNWEKEIRE